MEEDQEREAFERYIRSAAYPCANEKIVRRVADGRYNVMHIEMMWKGWAARAAQKGKAE